MWLFYMVKMQYVTSCIQEVAGYALVLIVDLNAWVFCVGYLQSHIEEIPEMAEAGARYVVVAYWGIWRDGEATNDATEISAIQRRLRQRFMNRLAEPVTELLPRIETASLWIARGGSLEEI